MSDHDFESKSQRRFVQLDNLIINMRNVLYIEFVKISDEQKKEYYENTYGYGRPDIFCRRS